MRVARGRLRHGAARDSLLGFRAVNGLGEAFSAGGKVVKNVTGFDLPKLVCGAFGTLCVLTELTFRVYPRPRFAATLALRGVTPDEGFAALRKIWLSALEPTGLAYLPGPSNLMAGIGKGAALIRFEAAEKPLAEKCAAARLLLGEAQEIENGDVAVCRYRQRRGIRVVRAGCLAAVSAAVRKRLRWRTPPRPRCGLAIGRAVCCGSQRTAKTHRACASLRQMRAAMPC